MQMRVEAARLVRALCNGSDLTLQTLISCGGLAVLVQFLGARAGGGEGPPPGAPGGERRREGDDGDNDDSRRLVRIGIDGVLKVFSLQRIRRNDFCKLFLRLGLMPRVMVRGLGDRSVRASRRGKGGERRGAESGGGGSSRVCLQ